MTEVRLCISFAVKPGTASEYVRSWLPHRDDVLGDAGCVQYELFQSTTSPESLVLLEIWSDRTAFDAHWVAELQRTPTGQQYRDPEIATVAEIYWERQRYRWDAAVNDWAAASLPVAG